MESTRVEGTIGTVAEDFVFGTVGEIRQRTATFGDTHYLGGDIRDRTAAAEPFKTFLKSTNNGLSDGLVRLPSNGSRQFLCSWVLDTQGNGIDYI